MTRNVWLFHRGVEGGMTCNQESNLASVTGVACARAARGHEDARGCKGGSVKLGCRWKMSFGGQDALCLSDTRLRSDNHGKWVIPPGKRTERGDLEALVSLASEGAT